MLIYIDNVGYGDLGCYGNAAVKTPHMDRLAADGVRCTDFYVGSPSCAPSRGAILSGRHPVRTGFNYQGLRYAHVMGISDNGAFLVKDGGLESQSNAPLRDGGNSVENVAIESMPGFFCTGNLYRPLKQDKPGPGVLCPHGHFRPMGRFREEHQMRCAHLARMGATVFAYSMVGWNDSRQTSRRDPFVLALQTLNGIAAIDFLSVMPEVAPARIGATGASGGGSQTFFLALVDERVTASCPVGIVYPWAAPLGCLCEGGMPVMQVADTNAIERPYQMEVFNDSHPHPTHALQGTEAVGAAFKVLPRTGRSVLAR